MPLSQKLKSRRRPRRKRIRFFIFIVILLAAGAAGYSLYYPKSTEQITEGVESVLAPAAEEPAPGMSRAELEANVQSILAEYPSDKVGISFLVPNTGETYTLNSTTKFTAASTTKTITAVCFLKRVELGKATLATSIGGYPAKDQLRQMINRSNNESLDSFNQYLGAGNLTSCAKSMGVNSFYFYNNTWIPDDATNLLRKLYTYQLLSREDTDLLLSLMVKTNEERLIPSGVPATATVYHKYGIYLTNLHDTAVVKDGKVYVLSIFTTNTKALNFDSRSKLIQRLSSQFYEYVNG